MKNSLSRSDRIPISIFIGLEGFQYSAPFDPSVMVYFRKGCRNRL
jgi:hypothetical protein